LALAEQFPSLAVTVYKVVTVGDATTVGPVVVDSPVDGDQVYEIPEFGLLAVIDVD
jgi:hypothetical protein